MPQLNFQRQRGEEAYHRDAFKTQSILVTQHALKKEFSGCEVPTIHHVSSPCVNIMNSNQ